MLSLEGKQLGNYDVIKRIRVGGMGAVYEGRQRTAFDRRVAIKVILGDYASDRDMRRRFAREARTIARLQHPHILPLIEFGDEQGILYLVMPFIDGGTLTNYLRHHLLDLDEVAAIYTQLLDAVEFAHEEGLIHRDIKSSNVLLEMRRSGPPHVYLGDFGLVRTMRLEADSHQAGRAIPLDQVPGTPHYMAPEQTRNIITTRTDIYALGVMLYQMLIGRLPYNDPDEIRVIQMHMHAPIPVPGEIDGSLPHELDMVIRKAMAKRAEDRFANIAELRIAFLDALHGSTPEASAPDELSPIIEVPISPPPRRVAKPTIPMPPPAPVENPASESSAEPAPLVLQKRQPIRETAPVALREARERARNTDTVRQKPAVLRITEEPVAQKTARKRRFLLPIILSALITLLLLAGLLIPPAFGFNLLSSGNQTPPVTQATVYIHVDQQALEDSFIVTASTDVQEPDVANRLIPARTVQERASTTRTVQTTGTRTQAATPAQGEAIFLNQSNAIVLIQPDQVFMASNNVAFHLLAPLEIPPRQNNQDGQAIAQLQAFGGGSNGNIETNVLLTRCCNDAVAVINPQPFQGGQDEQQISIVTEDDINRAIDEAKEGLQKDLNAKLQAKLEEYEVYAGKPTYSFDGTPNIAINEPANEVQVTVNSRGNATIYNQASAEQIAQSLLANQAKTQLAEGYQLQGNITTVTPPEPTDREGNEIYLSVRVHGLWTYTISEQQLDTWRESLKNTHKDVAQTYLQEQPGVESVEIQLPNGDSQFPTDGQDIQIVIRQDPPTA